MTSTKTEINQSSASAQRDIVAIAEQNNYAAPTKNPSVVEKLLEKLQKEIDENSHVQDVIESLKFYYNNRSHDGVDGLENKLTHSGRSGEIFIALEKKEQFVKVLEKWSMYASAQEILVHLLAKAEHEFSTYVLPQVTILPEHEVNQVISQKIVEPIVVECGATVFQMNHGIAMGMLYWLAEQCFVRWHK